MGASFFFFRRDDTTSRGFWNLYHLVELCVKGKKYRNVGKSPAGHDGKYILSQQIVAQSKGQAGPRLADGRDVGVKEGADRGSVLFARRRFFPPFPHMPPIESQHHHHHHHHPHSQPKTPPTPLPSISGYGLINRWLLREATPHRSHHLSSHLFIPPRLSSQAVPVGHQSWHI